jgi:hypothetical protein
MPISDNWPIIRSGTWLYAGVSSVAVSVLLSPETWGTCDYEDEEDTRDGKAVECYFLAYETAGAPGSFCNLVPNLTTLDEAVAHAEVKFPGIRWQAA